MRVLIMIRLILRRKCRALDSPPLLSFFNPFLMSLIHQFLFILDIIVALAKKRRGPWKYQPWSWPAGKMVARDFFSKQASKCRHTRLSRIEIKHLQSSSAFKHPWLAPPTDCF